MAPRAGLELATLRLTAGEVISSEFAGAKLNRRELVRTGLRSTVAGNRNRVRDCASLDGVEQAALKTSTFFLVALAIEVRLGMAVRPNDTLDLVLES